jgi:thiol-disulfide isomerase/thioredoxin
LSSDATLLIENKQTAAVGNKAKIFSISDIDGQTFCNSSLAGEAYMLVFSATWGGPCQVQLSRLKRLYEKYNKMGLKVVKFISILASKSKLKYLSVEFTDHIGTNIHGLEVAAFDDFVYMYKILVSSEDSNIRIETVEMSFENLMNYLGIRNLVDFDRFGEDYLWQMYQKGDALIHCSVYDSFGYETLCSLRLSNGQTLVENEEDGSIEILDEIIDSPAKIEAYFFKSPLE